MLSGAIPDVVSPGEPNAALMSVEPTSELDGTENGACGMYGACDMYGACGMYGAYVIIRPRGGTGEEFEDVWTSEVGNTGFARRMRGEAVMVPDNAGMPSSPKLG